MKKTYIFGFKVGLADRHECDSLENDKRLEKLVKKARELNEKENEESSDDKELNDNAFCYEAEEFCELCNDEEVNLDKYWLYTVEAETEPIVYPQVDISEKKEPSDTPQTRAEKTLNEYVELYNRSGYNLSWRHDYGDGEDGHDTHTIIVIDRNHSCKILAEADDPLVVLQQLKQTLIMNIDRGKQMKQILRNIIDRANSEQDIVASMWALLMGFNPSLDGSTFDFNWDNHVLTLTCHNGKYKLIGNESNYLEGTINLF